MSNIRIAHDLNKFHEDEVVNEDDPVFGQDYPEDREGIARDLSLPEEIRKLGMAFN